MVMNCELGRIREDDFLAYFDVMRLYIRRGTQSNYEKY
jgi:hypothetical protein